jgi:pimeloyl-ACP methyl ester carboxylesterase
MSAVDPAGLATDDAHRRTVAVDGAELSVVDVGSGPPVILAHGFPELAYSWRHQIGPIADAGYRVLAPDQRGYGRSSRPVDVTDYDIIHLTDDLLALLDDVGEEQAVFVGHDWGSMVVWALAQRAPERVAGVVGMSVPFVPRSDGPPIEMMRAVFGDLFFYMLYFQEPEVPDAELGGDPATMMRRMLAGLGAGAAPAEVDMFAPRAEGGFLPRLPEPAELPSWLSPAELDHYVAEFTRTGFTGGINWYRNLDRNWALTEDLAGATVTVPALFIAGGADPVLLMTPLTAMEERVPDLRGSVIIDGAGHWVQQEEPDAVNGPLLEFLASVQPPSA